MRDPRRIPIIIAALRAYWLSNPDLRLCQILGNFANESLPPLRHMVSEPVPGWADEQHVSGPCYASEDARVLAYLQGKLL